MSGYLYPGPDYRQLDLECEKCGMLHEDIRDMDEGMSLSLLTADERTQITENSEGEDIHRECGSLVWLVYQPEQTEAD